MYKTKMTKAYLPSVQLCIFSLIVNLLVLGIQPLRTIAQDSTSSTDSKQAANNAVVTIEPEILSEINRVRTDPQGYALWLEEQRQYYDGIWLKLPGEKPIRTNKGLKALEEAIAMLKEQSPLSALSKSEATAATATDKLDNFATAKNIQYISYGRTTPQGIVMSLVVDDLFPDRRRRKSLLSPDADNSGVVCKPDPTYAKVCAIAYSDSPVDPSVPETEPIANQPEPEQPEEVAENSEPTAETEAIASQPEPEQPEEVAENSEPAEDTEIAENTLPAPPIPPTPPTPDVPEVDPLPEAKQPATAQTESEEAEEAAQAQAQAEAEAAAQAQAEEEAAAQAQAEAAAQAQAEAEAAAQAQAEEEAAAQAQAEDDSEIVATNSDSSRILENVERGILEEGDLIITEDGSFYDSYPLQGESGESFIIYLESDQFDAFVALVDAQGNIVEQNDDIDEENSNSRIRVTLPEDGTYNVIVNAYDEGGTGEYILTIRR